MANTEPPAPDVIVGQDIPRRLVITVHGIRTFGAWQQRLEQELRDRFRLSVEFRHYRYGFFTLFAFLIPPLRWLATKRFQSELLQEANREKWSRIDIIAHSFGTHLVAWGLLRLPRPQRPAIHTIIFAGSVLKSSFPIREILGTCATRVVNDCGIQDWVLFASQVAVLLTGMAGRVGFIGMEGDHFRNRYFQFGHGGYFQDREPGSPNFMTLHWVPLLISESDIPPHDERQPNRFRDLTAMVLNNAEPIKIACYILPIILALVYVNQLRLTAQREAAIALSKQLAGQSELNRDSRLDLASLLSIEAGRAAITFESRKALLNIAELNPAMGYLRHPAQVHGLAFSPDGKILACASQDGTVRLWDLTNRQTLGEPLKGHIAYVYGVAFSPDGRMLASASGDWTVRLWDVATQRPLGAPLMGHTYTVLSAAFSPDGKTLASGAADNTVRLWDVATGRALGGPLKGHTNSVLSVVFSPDGKTLASASVDRTVQLWDVATGRVLGGPLKGHTNSVLSAVFSPDGKTLASASLDQTVRLWDVPTRRPLGDSLKGHASSVLNVAFGADGKTLVLTSSDGTVQLWDGATRQMLEEPLVGHAVVFSSVAISADRETLAAVGNDRTVRLWDLATRNTLGKPLKGHTEAVLSVAFSPDGKRLASASSDETARLWNVANGVEIAKRLKGPTNSMMGAVFSPDGKTLASIGGRHSTTLWLWEVSTWHPPGELLNTHPNPYVPGEAENASTVVSVAFGHYGTMLAFASMDQTVRLWDVPTRQPLGKPLKCTIGPFSSIALSPDGNVLATSTFFETVQLWDVAARQPLGEPLRGTALYVSSLMFSPDGKILAVGGQNESVQLWEVATRRPLGDPMIGQNRQVTSMAFSPDGETLAATSGDQTFRLWDVATRQELAKPLKGHTGAVTGVAFSPDGKTLASASMDQTVRLWDLNPVWWTSRACSLANRNLSLAEWQFYIGRDVPYRRTCPNLPQGEGAAVK